MQVNSFGRGYQVDTTDERDYLARSLLGATRTLPAEAMDLIPHVNEVRNQEGASACVGNALAAGIDARSSIMGLPRMKASAGGIYTFGRALARTRDEDDKLPPLVDDGCYPRLAMRGIREWGVPLEEVWETKTDPEGVNEEMPLDVMQNASGRTLSAWWRIPTFTVDRTTWLDQVAHAIAKKYPVPLGLDIDLRFQEYDGKEPLTFVEPEMILGGHMILIVGYRWIGNQRVWRCLNSWGTGWGDGGFFDATDRFFTGASDVYVIQIA